MPKYINMAANKEYPDVFGSLAPKGRITSARTSLSGNPHREGQYISYALKRGNGRIWTSARVTVILPGKRPQASVIDSVHAFWLQAIGI